MAAGARLLRRARRVSARVAVAGRAFPLHLVRVTIPEEHVVAEELHTNGSLAEVLSARARRTPRDRLVVDVVGGLAIAAVAAWARPGGWVALGAAAGCLASYGIWALAEVKLLPRPWPEQTPHAAWWRGLQQVAALLGVGAFVLFLFAALGFALGPIKS